MTVIPLRRVDPAPKPLLVEVFTHCSTGKKPEFQGLWTEAELLERKPVSCGSRTDADQSYGALSVLRKGILGNFGLREKVYISVNSDNFIRLRQLDLKF
jgi:hypothetical protein